MLKLKETESPKLNQAIVNLQGNPNFEIFYEWVKNSYIYLASLALSDISSSDTKHRIDQGRALNCYHIKNVIENAKQHLATAKEQNKGG